MFIRYISHQIRNPLNAVQLGIDCLEELINRTHGCCAQRDGQLEILRDMKGCLQSSIDILNDMLTSDKIRSGLISITTENTDVIAYVATKMQPYIIQVIHIWLCLLPTRYLHESYSIILG